MLLGFEVLVCYRFFMYVCFVAYSVARLVLGVFGVGLVDLAFLAVVGVRGFGFGGYGVLVSVCRFGQFCFWYI